MLIDNLLVHFKTQNNFDLRYYDIQDSSIVFIKNSKRIHTHGHTYKMVNWKVLDENVVPSGYSLDGTVNGNGGYN